MMNAKTAVKAAWQTVKILSRACRAQETATLAAGDLVCGAVNVILSSV